MPVRRTYIEEIEDPVTGETTVLEAETEHELDELVAEHFPDNPAYSQADHDTRHE